MCTYTKKIVLGVKCSYIRPINTLKSHKIINR